MAPSGGKQTAALALGGALWGAATAKVLVKHLPDRATSAAAPFLVLVAAIYPAARRSRHGSGAARREWASLLAWSALAAESMRSDRRRGQLLVAAGWAAHGVFDLAHDRGDGSVIPDWYPALCAGYDLGIAVGLSSAVARDRGNPPLGGVAEAP